MTSWDERDDMEYRPVTFWDYVAAAFWLVGLGAIIGYMLASWIGRNP